MQYGTILADPPWPYHSPRAVVGNAGRGSEGASEIIQSNVLSHYDTMTINEIKLLPIKKLTENKSHLYLWTTNSFMVEAHEVAKAWGFDPKTILTWVKMKHDEQCEVSMKTGWWYRSASEHIVFAVKGQQRLLGPAAPTAYLLPRIKTHSVKPDFFYELIEKESPGPYLELFARKTRAGWDCWGDAVDSTINLST